MNNYQMVIFFVNWIVRKCTLNKYSLACHDDDDDDDVYIFGHYLGLGTTGLGFQTIFWEVVFVGWVAWTHMSFCRWNWHVRVLAAVGGQSFESSCLSADFCAWVIYDNFYLGIFEIASISKIVRRLIQDLWSIYNRSLSES